MDTLALVLLGCGLAINGLSLLTGLHYLARLRLPATARPARVSILLPLTGELPRLHALLAALAAQSLPPRRLIVAVESTADPAFRQVRALAATQPFTVDIVVAGEASGQAQKCRNLVAAAASLDGDDDAVVLMDGDIEPPPWWLSALATPLINGHADIVTGYRWQMLAAPRLGAHLISLVDRALPLMPRLGAAWSSVVWGGSTAVSRQALAALDLAECFRATLSDDLALARRAHRLGLRILTRGALLLPTPNRHGLASGWRFGRRQYQMIRLYRPGLWWLASGLITLRLGAWAAVPVLAGLGSALAAPGLAGLLLLAVAKLRVVDAVGARLGFREAGGAQALRYTLGGPLQAAVDAFHLSMILAAARPREIVWGHVHYAVSAPDRIRISARRPWPPA